MRGWITSSIARRLGFVVAAILLPLCFGAAARVGDTGDLASLRAEALALVNEARSRHGLDPLHLTETLNSAAQAHAEDMLARNYYSHTAPEGEEVGDRYRQRGGSRWEKVAENIARCTGCPSVPTTEGVSEFHEGWMNSPGHRRNILATGLEGFGFGIIGESGRQFAVQTFAGPGMPLALKSDEEPVALSAKEQIAAAARLINAEREREGRAGLKTSEALNALAQRLLPKDLSDDRVMERPDGFFELLPSGSAREWRTITVAAGGCGGCGTQPTGADIRYFVDQWLENFKNRAALLGSEPTHLGFAMLATGEGRKVAIAVAGKRQE
ncbi:CAP domain-containing protein [Ensifer sp. NBAIM29]|nr:CAP domain-containing protein [Ensifer sp. NBAIM29]